MPAVEAALTAARELGISTALFTLNLDRIAWQPCNPAVGGSRPRASWCMRWMPSAA
jgi:tRNA U34 5-carboxymethylaminomethyl modifying enzyme MnmG/GidA